jgi:hypothetical protein
VYIGILGFLGVVVPLIRDLAKMGKREKAFWTFMTFALLLLELKSVYQDRKEHDSEQSKARAEQLAEFGKIARGIDTTIAENQHHFDATMSRFVGVTRLQRAQLENEKELKAEPLTQMSCKELAGRDHELANEMRISGGALRPC